MKCRLADADAYLNDPRHVVAFQNWFQLRWADPNDEPPKKAPGSRDSGGSSSDSAAERRPAAGGRGFVVGNRFWYWLFLLATALGEEAFYASVFPFWFWNVDSAVGRRVTVVWALSMYIGQGLKDVILRGRPASPPVIRVQRKGALECGMPSTHAMVSLTVPVSVFVLTAERYEYRFALGVAVVIVWCLLVSASRMYLGMHSPGDLLGGWTLALLLLPVFLPLSQSVDRLLLTHPASPLILVAATVGLMLAYPSQPSHRDSTAQEDTATILGSTAGLQLGSWMSYQLGSIRGPPMPPPHPILWPSFEMMGLMLLRTSIGLVALVATRALTKSLCYGLVGALGGRNATPSSGPQIERTKSLVRVGTKLVTYGAIGVTITWFSPAVFRLIGIERSTVYTEM